MYKTTKRATTVHSSQLLYRGLSLVLNFWIPESDAKLKMSTLLNIFGLLLLTSMVMCNAVDSSVPRIGKRTVNNEFIDASDLTPPQDPAINTFPKEPTVPLIPTCLHAGYFRDPFNCGKFYHCHHSQAIARTYYCQHGLIFNEQTERCEDPYFVDC